MLFVAKKLRELSFGSLMAVYQESNGGNGAIFWPEKSPEEQIFQAELEFYQYLRSVFFPTHSALYCIWIENTVYISALRLEPFRDGLLLEALETAPQFRRQGYAEKLIRAVQEMLEERGSGIIYSHVAKWNHASLRVHEKCGFVKCADRTIYVDGSVDCKSWTLRFEYGKPAR